MAKLTCRGPRIQDISIFNEPVTRNADHTLAEALVMAIERREGKGPAQKASQAFDDIIDNQGTTDDLLSLCFDRGLLQLATLVDKKSREKCGYDLTGEFKEYPGDGELRSMECPGCGQEISFRRGKSIDRQG